MMFVRSIVNLLLVASCNAFVAPHAKRVGVFGVETCRRSAVADASTEAVAAGDVTEQKIRNVAVIAHVDHGKTTL